MGSSSRTNETILSWSLVGRPVPAPYQYSGNDGHSFSTDGSHKMHSPLLSYDLDRQCNSGLLYQQTRRNTFFQPMHRGMENPPLVPGIQYRDQSTSYPRQIQHIGRPFFEIRQAFQNRIGFGSIGRELHLPNAQLPQCGFVCNTIQSQTPIVCISRSGQSCINDGCIVSGLELSSCICIPTDNSDTICTSQDLTISVQNSSYCSSVAQMYMVFRGVNQSLLMAMLHSLIARRGWGLRLNDSLFLKLTSGLGLDDMSLAWPAVVQLLVFFYSCIQLN